MPNAGDLDTAHDLYAIALPLCAHGLVRALKRLEEGPVFIRVHSCPFLVELNGCADLAGMDALAAERLGAARFRNDIQLEKSNGRPSALLAGIIQSAPFQKTRNAAPVAAGVPGFSHEP
jgi:hypothetical protein